MKSRFQHRREPLFSPERLLLLLLIWGTATASFFLLPRDGWLPNVQQQWRGREGGNLSTNVSASDSSVPGLLGRRSCATVEEMGQVYRDGFDKESLRVRALIHRHFQLHGAANLQRLYSDEFCKQGFVLGKASEAGFGNEMYKILTAAALSVMLNRSLIIGQNRGKFPFENYISFSNISVTLKEVKHLWRKHKCAEKYGRDLVIRFDDFQKPRETDVLCRDWRKWKQPIIWFQGTVDAVGIQFFLKNIHPGMRQAAFSLFGQPGSPQTRANVFGELMKVIVSPSQPIQEIVNWVINGGADPDLALHMRMLTHRPLRAKQAALNCLKKALDYHRKQIGRPKIVLASDTPSFIKDIMPEIMEFSDVIHFDYKSFIGTIPGENDTRTHQLDFRQKDWGPAPRWVAFVDFFLAARAKYAVISGAHRRVGTTYAQLVAALAAANSLNGDSSVAPRFSFFSSFQSNLLVSGLAHQVGWGHVWNRYAGPLSCVDQPHQCAHTPLLPPAWWDGDWQSPISRDVRRLEQYGVQLTNTGKVSEGSVHSFCKSSKESFKIIPIIRRCYGSKCI